MMRKSIVFILSTLLALCVFPGPALADDDEMWWGAAQREAQRDDYKLIHGKELAKLLDAGADLTIVDVRADYEFVAGHIPQSKNLEFDLGDKARLTPTKKQAFKDLVGSDRKRTLVLYCRSFR